MRVLLVLALAACQREPSAMDNLTVGTANPADCTTVGVRVQEAVQSQVDHVGADAKLMIARLIPATKTACVEDHWPADLTKCIVDATPGDLPALNACNRMMSKELQDKLQARMLLKPKPQPQ